MVLFNFNIIIADCHLHDSDFVGCIPGNEALALLIEDPMLLIMASRNQIGGASDHTLSASNKGFSLRQSRRKRNLIHLFFFEMPKPPVTWLYPTRASNMEDYNAKVKAQQEKDNEKVREKRAVDVKDSRSRKRNRKGDGEGDGDGDGEYDDNGEGGGEGDVNSDGEGDVDGEGGGGEDFVDAVDAAAAAAEELVFDIFGHDSDDGGSLVVALDAGGDTSGDTLVGSNQIFAVSSGDSSSGATLGRSNQCSAVNSGESGSRANRSNQDVALVEVDPVAGEKRNYSVSEMSEILSIESKKQKALHDSK